MNLRDLTTRALHTFWQSFAASLAAAFAASGVGLDQFTSLDDAKRALLALAAAVGAAALSAAKTTVTQLVTARRRPVDTGTGKATPLADVIDPAPLPDQPAAP